MHLAIVVLFLKGIYLAINYLFAWSVAAIGGSTSFQSYAVYSATMLVLINVI